MKRLLLFELLLLILATTFESDSPPGWFQQTLPVNDQINDIFFLDSLTGWVVTNSNLSSSDSGYIMKTTSGGESWTVQNRGVVSFNVIQFLNLDTGYAGAVNPLMACYKTIDGGSNWSIVSSMLTGLTDMFFVNNDTGWYCDPSGFGGLYKTTNGGLNWLQQLNDTYQPKKFFFINKDTGWVTSEEANGKLYRTTNGGANWNLQFTFAGSPPNLFFVNKDTGYTSSYKTIDGGFNWVTMNNNLGGAGLFFINNTTGYNCAGFSVLQKTVDGQNWYSQIVPTGTGYLTIQFIDSLRGWAGGSILIHTTDGGGPFVGIHQISTEVPSEYRLYQNYPNPFNPSTNIKYQIVNSKYVRLMVYDIQGKQVTELVNQKQNAGTYEADWNASGSSSGIYFYSLIIDGKIIDTKRMILLR